MLLHLKVFLLGFSYLLVLLECCNFQFWQLIKFFKRSKGLLSYHLFELFSCHLQWTYGFICPNLIMKLKPVAHPSSIGVGCSCWCCMLFGSMFAACDDIPLHTFKFLFLCLRFRVEHMYLTFFNQDFTWIGFIIFI